MELADVTDSKSVGATRAGSSPATGTIFKNPNSDPFFMMEKEFGFFVICKKHKSDLKYIGDIGWIPKHIFFHLMKQKY